MFFRHAGGINMNQETKKSELPASGRKTYSTPALVEYGSISKLTMGIVSNGNNDGAGMMNAVCL